MSTRELYPFNYIDIKPLNYNSKQQLLTDLEEISKSLENTTLDWKKREASLKKIGCITKGNFSKSDSFIKYFNNKLCLNLEIQLKDLRSSITKEACKITSLCAKELGLLIETGIDHLFSQYVLFKIAGSANRVIADSASKCILNIIKYINSIKIISNVCEQKTIKANAVRIIVAQCLVNIFCYYDSEFIIKTRDILEETLSLLLSDANGEVRATTRRAFIIYKSRFNEEAELLFNELGKNVQKQLKEDEKNFGNNIEIHINNKDENEFLSYSNKDIIEYKTRNNDLKAKPKTPDLQPFPRHKLKNNIDNEKDKNITSASKDKIKHVSKKSNENIVINDNKETIINNEDELDVENLELDNKKEKNATVEEPKYIISNFNYVPKSSKLKQNTVIIKNNKAISSSNINEDNKNDNLKKSSNITEMSNNEKIIFSNNTEPNDNIKKISEEKSAKIIKIENTKNQCFIDPTSDNRKKQKKYVDNKQNKSISNITTGNTSNDYHTQSTAHSKGNIISSNFELVKNSNRKTLNVFADNNNTIKYKIKSSSKEKIKLNNSNLIKSENFNTNINNKEINKSIAAKIATHNMNNNRIERININIENDDENEKEENKNKRYINSNKNECKYKFNNSNLTKTNNTNIFNQPMEQKIKILINKLDNIINSKEKLLIFQYLFNNFNEILKDYNKNNISQNTLKKYIDIHIDNLKENDKILLEQIIKNLMRMIFYMNQIFDIYEIESILKILLFSFSNSNDKTLIKLSNELLEIIRKKCDNEELFKTVYGLLREFNSNHDNCYEFMSLLIPECDNIFNNNNYFKQIFRLICLTETSSNKVGKIIDILYRKYNKYFIQAYKEENVNNQNKILYFMEKSNSFYFREFKAECESDQKSNNKILSTFNIQEVKKENETHKKNKISDIPQDNIAKSRIKSGNINKSVNFSDKSIKNSTIDNSNLKTEKNNSMIKLENNNYNESNNLSGNILLKDSTPNEIKIAIENNNSKLFMKYMDEHRSYIPNFFLLLSNKNYNDLIHMYRLLNFTEKLVISNNFPIDLNPCVQLIIRQIITLMPSFKDNSNIIDLMIKLLSELPLFLNAEKFFIGINKYLTLDNDIFILETLLQIIKDYIIKANEEIENLLNLFIDNIFGLLNHQNSEIRKRAVYCCVEVYLIIGKKFDVYINKVPKTQQNLIRLFIKKRTG